MGFAVLLLVVVSFWAGSNWNKDNQIPELKQVAVLPLASISNNEDEPYFTVGMTEDLIDELSKIDQLTVINQNSTQVLTSGFNPSNRLVSNVISGIDYFVNGRLERDDNTISVHMELKESINDSSILAQKLQQGSF